MSTLTSIQQSIFNEFNQSESTTTTNIDLNPRSFLLTYPPNSYTVIRTYQQSINTAAIKFHSNRLIQSAELLTDNRSIRILLNELEPRLNSLIQKILINIHQSQQSNSNNSTIDSNNNNTNNREYLITILIINKNNTTNNNNSSSSTPTVLYELIGHLYPITITTAIDPIPAVNIGIYGPARTNPLSKDSQWIIERQSLEQHKSILQCEEIILQLAAAAAADTADISTDTDNTADNNSNTDIVLTEGLTSNLFILDHTGILYTAPDKLVLNGYIRQLIIESIQNSINTDTDTVTVLTNINTTTGINLTKLPINQWSAAFITSAGRFIQPIKRVSWYNSNNIVESIELPNANIYTMALNKLVSDYLESQYQSIPDINCNKS